MKCPKCSGTGIDDDRLICYECDGTGEYEPFDADIELDKLYPTELTNEEWLKQCNTEQLADVLWEQINGAFNSGYACCNLKQDKDYVGRYKRFKEWLKQPHSEVRK